ncbi:MAG: Mov34/MPN/PAD-1 family protein [Brevibacillus sp.]|nr:Mov34/MPN/PAD-1 family protein [Brevibacillus sp.]
MFPAVLGEPFANKHTKLQMEGKVVKRLVAEGREALPNEYTALLAGWGSRITRHHPASPAGGDRHSFRWSGPELIEALACIGQEGHCWLGVLHTHPSTAAIPSSVDAANWHYPQLSYWILSFSGQTPVLRAYQWVDGSFFLRPYEILPG